MKATAAPFAILRNTHRTSSCTQSLSPGILSFPRNLTPTKGITPGSIAGLHDLKGSALTSSPTTLRLRHANGGILTGLPTNPRTGLATMVNPERFLAGLPPTAKSKPPTTMPFVLSNPAGKKTGKLLPTGSPRDKIRLGQNGECVKISCIDAADPVVFLTLSKLNALLLSRSIQPLPTDPDAFLAADFPTTVMDILENIRRQAAIKMGLDPNLQAYPKICVIRPTEHPDADYDFAVKTVSRGVLHQVIPGAVALCLAAAVGIRGSVVNVAHTFVVQRKMSSGEPDHSSGPKKAVEVRIGVPGGVLDVTGRFARDGKVKSVALEPAASELLRGEAFW